MSIRIRSALSHSAARKAIFQNGRIDHSSQRWPGLTLQGSMLRQRTIVRGFFSESVHRFTYAIRENGMLGGGTHRATPARPNDQIQNRKAYTSQHTHKHHFLHRMQWLDVLRHLHTWLPWLPTREALPSKHFLLGGWHGCLRRVFRSCF